jgi:hypothetical protein
MIVMITAMTPSVNASSLPLSIERPVSLRGRRQDLRRRKCSAAVGFEADGGVMITSSRP